MKKLLTRIFSKLRLFKRIREIEEQLLEQDMQYNSIQRRISKVARTLTDEVEKNKHEIINVKAIVIQIEEELKRIEEVLKNGRDWCWRNGICLFMQKS